MFKDKNLNIFIRYGGLNIKKQKWFGNDTYHSPPASRGIYAMPYVAQELFLISSLDKYQPGILPKLRNDIRDEIYYKKRKRIISNISKKFIVKNGNLWHHLIDYIDKKEILAINNTWVKTSIKAWKKAFSKMSLESRYGDHGFNIKSINETRGILGYYSKDNCEVFFDEKI